MKNAVLAAKAYACFATGDELLSGARTEKTLSSWPSDFSKEVINVAY